MTIFMELGNVSGIVSLRTYVRSLVFTLHFLVRPVDSEDSLRTNEMMFETLAELS
jgi:hypothetical protein